MPGATRGAGEGRSGFLRQARDAGRLHKGENVVMVGFGAGLTYGSLVVKWQKDEEARA